MSELKFNRVNNEKYNTVSINIENGSLELKKDCEIIKAEKTKFGYRKAVIKLNTPELIEKVKSWETQIKDYLKNVGIEPITILYGNRIYPKLSENKKINILKFKGVWVNDQNKPFVQLWFE